MTLPDGRVWSKLMASRDDVPAGSGGQAHEVDIGHCRLRAKTWGSGIPGFVLLHDGLGSVELWRELPGLLAEATGSAVLAYDRPGHGLSSPHPNGHWPISWMQDQGRLLPGLLDAFEIQSPILVGHSDGGSIALYHASKAPDWARGVVALAPHSFVEDRCVSAISKLRSDPRSVVAALGPYHADAAALFEAWSGAWTSPDFAEWDIRPDLSTVACPTLIVQGEDDEYATEAMVHQTVASIGSESVEGRILPGLGHMLTRQDPDLILETILGFTGPL